MSQRSCCHLLVLCSLPLLPPPCADLRHHNGFFTPPLPQSRCPLSNVSRDCSVTQQAILLTHVPQRKGHRLSPRCPPKNLAKQKSCVKCCTHCHCLWCLTVTHPHERSKLGVSLFVVFRTILCKDVAWKLATTRKPRGDTVPWRWSRISRTPQNVNDTLDFERGRSRRFRS